MIGAGPGGLAAARWLLSQGFDPTIFEQGPMLGGQWTGLPGLSGVWPTMHTNTCRILTARAPGVTGPVDRLHLGRRDPGDQ